MRGDNVQKSNFFYLIWRHLNQLNKCREARKYRSMLRSAHKKNYGHFCLWSKRTWHQGNDISLDTGPLGLWSFFLPLKTHRNIKPSVYMWGKSQTISDLNVSRSSRFCRHSLTKIRNYRFPRLFGMIGEK